ncbi:MAG: hypothetical protein NC935_08220 [Candidatus Omnitrophica bacterium]|nr:hypothetical protein [Candidatus Omnitrophota bacterium]
MKKEKINEKFCCKIIKNKKQELEDYINNLIEAPDDFNKNKWAWGILKSTEKIFPIKKTKKTLCKNCKDYISSRKRLAELIIFAAKQF